MDANVTFGLVVMSVAGGIALTGSTLRGQCDRRIGFSSSVHEALLSSVLRAGISLRGELRCSWRRRRPLNLAEAFGWSGPVQAIVLSTTLVGIWAEVANWRLIRFALDLRVPAAWVQQRDSRAGFFWGVMLGGVFLTEVPFAVVYIAFLVAIVQPSLIIALLAPAVLVSTRAAIGVVPTLRNVAEARLSPGSNSSHLLPFRVSSVVGLAVGGGTLTWAFLS